MDELHDRIVADLLAEPRVCGLLAEALRLTSDDTDRSAALVMRRLRRDRRCDAAARATVRRAALALAWEDAAASRHRALDVGAQATVAAWTSETTRRRSMSVRRRTEEALTRLQAIRAHLERLADDASTGQWPGANCACPPPRAVDHA